MQSTELFGEYSKGQQIDWMEFGLEKFIRYSDAKDRMTNEAGEKRWWITRAFYAAWSNYMQLPDTSSWSSFVMSSVDRQYGYTALKNLVNDSDIATGKEITHFLGIGPGAKGVANWKDNLEGFEGATNEEKQQNALKDFILVDDININDFEVEEPYIRWDALCNFITNYVIDRDGAGRPLITLTTNTICHEDQKGKEIISPLTFIRPPQSIPGCSSTYQWTSYNFTINQILDVSVDPAICLKPNQLHMFKNTNAFNKWVGFGMGCLGPVGMATGILYKKYSQRRDTTEEGKLGPLNNRSIGHIYINLKRLQTVYHKQRYNDEGEKNSDFNLHDFIQKIWDDIGNATGGVHNFKLHNDTERPDVMRIVDLNFQPDDELDPDKVHEIKIQSNETVCRDFSYTSVIPSELSTTIAVAVQNPDAIDDLDNASFKAMNKGIKSRFHVPVTYDTPEPTKEEKEAEAAKYDVLVLNTENLLINVLEHNVETGWYGGNQEVDEEGESTENEAVGEAASSLKRAHANTYKLLGLHGEDGTYTEGDHKGEKYYKGYPKKVAKAPPASSVIPLKFNAKMDGIGGIVIGSVFKVDPTRLPKAYKANDIAFVCMGESQEITSGQDWTTTIHGNMILLATQDEIVAGEKEAEKNSGLAGELGGGSSNSAGATLASTATKILSELSASISSSVTSSITESVTPVVSSTNPLDVIDDEATKCQKLGYNENYEWDEELQTCVLKALVNVVSDKDDTKEIDELYKKWKNYALKAISHEQMAGDFSSEVFFHTNRVFTSDKSSAFFENGIIHSVNARNFAYKATKVISDSSYQRDLLDIFLSRWKGETDDRAIMDVIATIKGQQSGTLDKDHLSYLLGEVTKAGKDWSKKHYINMYSNVGVPPQGTSTTNGSYLIYFEYKELYKT